MEKVAVIGAGSWGTALSSVLAENRPEVMLWARRPELGAAIRETRQNPDYLPGLTLPATVHVTSDPEEAVRDREVVVLVVPSHAVRSTVRMLAPYLKRGAVLVNCSKGLEEGTLARISVVLKEEAPASPVAVLSGPNHAEEVGARIPSVTVVSSRVRAVAEKVQDLFMTPYFRVYTNRDLAGVELGGALKNIVALGVGITDGLGFGDNTKAALMTRGLTEIARLGVRIGADPLTFAGLSGVGDLIVTCTSRHSRNLSLGIALGRGGKLKDILAGMRMVAEGVRTTQAAYQLSLRHEVNMPITAEIHNVLFGGKDGRAAVEDLMRRDRTHEHEDILHYRRDYW
jgi:glycerol-3-phosphate dehydrogenase (NAD(P)+)